MVVARFGQSLVHMYVLQGPSFLLLFKVKIKFPEGDVHRLGFQGHSQGPARVCGVLGLTHGHARTGKNRPRRG